MREWTILMFIDLPFLMKHFPNFLMIFVVFNNFDNSIYSFSFLIVMLLTIKYSGLRDVEINNNKMIKA